MKTIYIVLGIVLIVVLGGGFFLLNNKQESSKALTENAQVKQESAVSNEKVNEGSMMGTGYIMKAGKMMVEENHQFSPMTSDVTFENGTVVSTAGLVTKKDGSSFTLIEGQSIWSDGTFMEKEAVEESNATSLDSSLENRYVDYSDKALAKATEKNGKAILFFAALAWCPSCQAADKDFKANFNKVPSDITILKVDYDTAKSMKQKYAITMQDTFIQVDSNGSELTRWNSGGQGVNALLANAK